MLRAIPHLSLEVVYLKIINHQPLLTRIKLSLQATSLTLFSQKQILKTILHLNLLPPPVTSFSKRKMLTVIPRLSLQALSFNLTNRQQARTLLHPSRNNKQRHSSSPLKPLSLIVSSALRKQLIWCHQIIMFHPQPLQQQATQRPICFNPARLKKYHLKAQASSIRLSKNLSKRRKKASKATCLLQIKQIQYLLLLRICSSLKRKTRPIYRTNNRTNQFHHLLHIQNKRKKASKKLY